VLGDEKCWWCAKLFVMLFSALCTMLLRLRIRKRAWGWVAVRAAPIWPPCHRRALRPVPQAPERAFVVTRA
jgi:apolipoprotein N-acyltransferase